MMLRPWFILIVTLTVDGSAASRGGPAGDAVESFKVEVSIDRSSFDKNSTCFLVDARVTNDGNRDEQVISWTNQAWSWVSGTPSIVLNTSAKQNLATRMKLLPKQSHAVKVPICRALAAKPATFRLGFVPRAEAPASGQADLKKWGGVFWSNVVSLAFR
jgi:hypothetical protein